AACPSKGVRFQEKHMNIRTLLIAAGLATLASGCVVAPDYDRGYGPGYPVYGDTDAYGGYYYVQIIYIDGEPWYVDDYRRAHPIPPRLRSHFRYSSWTRSLPPRFGDDDDVRDGYRLSRIVYVNDVPVYVDDDRRARPLPERVRSQFRYQGVVMPQPPAYGREREMPPANGRMQQREMQGPNGRMQQREMQGPDGRMQQREMQGPDGRMQQREMPPSNGRERERRAPPAYGPQNMPSPTMAPERMRMAPPVLPAQPAVRDDRGGPTMAPERMRVAPPVLPAQPAVRDGRGGPAEQPAGRGAGAGRPMRQESGRGAIDGQRPGSADQKKNGKPSGRGADRNENGREKGRGAGDQPRD
ncbi:MAG: hypothetical protein ACM3KD_08780, partial [Hyphomicrobiaceae bacterium]